MGARIVGGDGWTFSDLMGWQPPTAYPAPGPRRLCWGILMDAIRVVRQQRKVSEEEVAEVRAWVTGAEALFSFTDCCEGMGLAPDPIRRGLLALLDATAVFPVEAACVPHPPKVRPGWICCARCAGVSPVHDVLRTTLCAPCGRRTGDYYPRRRRQRARYREARVA